MKLDPTEIIRALYDIPAYRGSMTGGERGKWWASTPKEANTYTGADNFWNESHHRPTMIPGQIDTSDFVEINAQGQTYSYIPIRGMDGDLLAEVLKSPQFRQTTPGYVHIDDLAEAIERLGKPGMTVRSVVDQANIPHTQYFVNDPSRRRARFARYEDPFSDDLMAQLALALTGVGSGSAAIAALNQDEEA